MANVTSSQSASELDQMHAVYRQGGADRKKEPHAVYKDGGCPHSNCTQPLQAIDFRLEAFGRAIHDLLVRAWWSDVGFVGQCPQCKGWIHFTIRGKRAIEESAAANLPQLPTDWANEAVIL
jgi:hypothetical protein